MDSNELMKNGINGGRLHLALALRSLPADVIMVLLIIVYSILIIFYFSIVDTFFPDDTHIFMIVELVLLGLFVVEVILHIVAYGVLYVKDCWNIFDMIIIILSIVFVFLDLFISDGDASLQGLFKIRGVFRLVRILILIRKLNTLRIKRDHAKRNTTFKGMDLRSPLERVLEILNNLRDKIDTNEAKIIQQLNYCIKTITTN
jgi:hypothetical protein